MKIIDLLNKIANGEEVPKKIKYYGDIFQFIGYNSASKNYYSEHDDLFEVLDGSVLNEEIEIIEEEKKIPEKMGLFEIQEQELSEIDENTKLTLDYKKVSKEFSNIHKKIEEIIDYLDYLKSKGE